MDRTNQLSIKLSLDSDIDCLSSKIISLVRDDTIVLAARGIAQYLLLCENMRLEEACALFDKPGADTIVWKLISCQSEFMGPTPRSVGIDLVSECAASKLQSSLDVKHIKKTSDLDSVQIDRIKPQRKIDLAYSHPTAIWIRFYSQHTNIEIPNTTLLEVTTNVYELYCSKNIPTLFEIMAALEHTYNADLIFCSEVPAFLYNPLLFLSNYIKFMWCYAMNRNIFDPTSYEDIRMMMLYTTYGLMFLTTNNLSSMSSATHGPLISCSGERPRVTLGKFDTSKVYINEGSRAMQSLNKASDFGTCSNFVEVVTKVSIDPICLSKII